MSWAMAMGEFAHARLEGAPEVARATLWPMRIRMTRRQVGNGLWTCDSWSVTAIDSEHDVTTGRSCETTMEGEAHHFDWRGLALELHRDERAAYRFNLASRSPRLFVHCNADDSGRMAPALLTASQDVAACYMDGGEEDVFSFPMPVAIQCWIEAFIAHHGEPDIALGKSHRRQRGKPRPDSERERHD